MKNLKTVFLAFREMHRLEKRLIPTAVTVALVTAVMPFVNIWFTSKIIDLLEGGAGMKKSCSLYRLGCGYQCGAVFHQLLSRRYAVCLSLADV